MVLPRWFGAGGRSRLRSGWSCELNEPSSIFDRTCSRSAVVCNSIHFVLYYYVLWTVCAVRSAEDRKELLGLDLFWDENDAMTTVAVGAGCRQVQMQVQ